MRSQFTVLPVLALACGLSVFAQATPQKFAIINMQQVILETKDGQQAVVELKAKFAPKEAEFQKRAEDLQRKQDELRKTENTISDEKKAALTRDIDSMTKSLQRDTDDAREDVNQEQQKVLNVLGGKIMQVLNKYASDKQYTMVFDVSGQPNNILFASSAIDITREIITMYDASAPASPAAAKPPAPSSTTSSAPAPRRTAPAAPAATAPAK
ncbi:MAG: OmpH family outer membrane protein [Bryobacteraceae bacterium]|jgi:outer membrane protein